MKKIVTCVLAFVALTLHAHADTWQNHWERAVENCGGKNYKAAETEFGLAILSLETNNDESHPHVYVDRARLYLLQDRYTESLIDLNKALESKHLMNTDRIRGLVTRIFTCVNLQMDDQVLADYDAFKAMSPNFPKVEFTNESVVIRNMPNSNCYRSLAKAFLISSEICESETDIKELDSGIMIAKRKIVVDSGCPCDVERNLAILGSQKPARPAPQKPLRPNNEQQNPPKPSNDQQNADNCKWWCDKCAIGGIAWCAKVFKRWDCQTGCIFAVDLIKDGCYWCCSSGSFYQKCVKPFEDILSYMGQPCDPYWD